MQNKKESLPLKGETGHRDKVYNRYDEACSRSTQKNSKMHTN